MKISFVGLGIMGKHMAVNLLKSGHEITVYDVVTTKFAECEAAGTKTTDSLDIVSQGDIICFCLPSSKIVETVLYGERGIFPTLQAGQTVIDFSTITYATTLKIAADLTAIGVHFLDAPVSGMEARARDGTLTVMCGGEEKIFREMLHLMEWVGNKILYMGRHGSGQLTKLINQLLFDINAAGLAEILPMAVKMGLDPEKVGEVINSGTGRSYASEFFVPRDLANVFDEGYPMEHAYKDLVSAAELGTAQCIPLPVLAAATATYQQALLKGYGKMGKGGMIKVYEELLGVAFRAKEEKQ